MLKDFVKTAFSEPEKVFALEYQQGSDERVLRYKDLIRMGLIIQKRFGSVNADKSIGVFIDNRVEFVSAFIGALLNGYTIVPICTTMRLNEINKIVYENNMDTILTVRDFGNQLEMLDNIELFYLDECDKPNIALLKSYNYVKADINDIAVVSYTSGTSGQFSKGVKLSYRSISFVSYEYKSIYEINKDSCIITVLPLWHNYAMFACLTSSIVAGSKLVILRKWDYNDFVKVCDRYKPDVFPGSPYILLSGLT
jgi:long-chain acyl-CoA synthetase